MSRRPSEPSPVQRPTESDLNFIVRVADWLAEPDRRRLGNKTAIAVKEAARRLRGES